MDKWVEIKLEPEEFIIKDEPVDTVEELVTEESHETDENDKSLNINSDSHCVDESQELLEDITDKIKVKTEGVDEIEQQEFQAACSSSSGRKIGQQPKDEDSSNLQAQGSGKKFQCTQCLKVFDKKKYLTQHIKEVHEGKKEFKCAVCGIGFVRKGGLKLHMKIHGGNKPFKCAVCERGFVTKGHLKLHMKIHVKREQQGSGTQFQCKQCLKVFDKKQYLTQHIKEVHEGKKEFKCAVCGIGFVRKGDLKHHMYTHGAKKPFKCAACGRSFVTSYHLKRHMKIHVKREQQGSRAQFQCKQCLKVFDKKQYLNEHIKKVHEGKKQFKCIVCGIGFVRKGYLKYHMKIHEGNKAFKCAVCGRSFVRKSDLKRHMKIHESDKQAASSSSYRQEIDQQPKAEGSSSLQSQGSEAQFQ